jgi:hypothetical protein
MVTIPNSVGYRHVNKTGFSGGHVLQYLLHKILFDDHSSSARHESGIPSLSMLEFIDQKIKEMNAS